MGRCEPRIQEIVQLEKNMGRGVSAHHLLSADQASSLNTFRDIVPIRFFFKKFQRAIIPQWEITRRRKFMGQLFSYEESIYEISRLLIFNGPKGRHKKT